MKLKIRYFAALRESAGKSEEELETASCNPRILFDELIKKYHFNVDQRHLKVSINRQYSDWNTILTEGDEIVFIPPVAGG